MSRQSFPLIFFGQWLFFVCSLLCLNFFSISLYEPTLFVWHEKNHFVFALHNFHIARRLQSFNTNIYNATDSLIEKISIYFIGNFHIVILKTQIDSTWIYAMNRHHKLTGSKPATEFWKYIKLIKSNNFIFVIFEKNSLSKQLNKKSHYIDSILYEILININCNADFIYLLVFVCFFRFMT